MVLWKDRLHVSAGNLLEDVSANSWLRDDTLKFAYLAGGQVELRMPNRGIRRWKAKGLTDRSAREMKFPVDEEGREISVAEYYQETYNLPCAP